MQSIHITTLRKILSSPEPIDIRLWTRSGEIQSWHRCISLKYDFYKGTRRMKLLDSNEIRQLRDVCIFEVNGIEVYMQCVTRSIFFCNKINICVCMADIVYLWFYRIIEYVSGIFQLNIATFLSLFLVLSQKVAIFVTTIKVKNAIIHAIYSKSTVYVKQ